MRFRVPKRPKPRSRWEFSIIPGYCDVCDVWYWLEWYWLEGWYDCGSSCDPSFYRRTLCSRCAEDPKNVREYHDGGTPKDKWEYPWSTNVRE